MAIFTVAHLIGASVSAAAGGYGVHWFQSRNIVAKAKADLASVEKKVADAVAAVKAKV